MTKVILECNWLGTLYCISLNSIVLLFMSLRIIAASVRCVSTMWKFMNCSIVSIGRLNLRCEHLALFMLLISLSLKEQPRFSGQCASALGLGLVSVPVHLVWV